MDEEIKEYSKMEAEADEVKEFYRRLGLNEDGIDKFFLEIIRTENNNKIGNLTDDELGMPLLPVRTLLELERDCEGIESLSALKTEFKSQANAILGTSLTREGFLIKARITQKKELLDNQKKKKRTGWFGKKEEEVNNG